MSAMRQIQGDTNMYQGMCWEQKGMWNASKRSNKIGKQYINSFTKIRWIAQPKCFLIWYVTCKVRYWFPTEMLNSEVVTRNYLKTSRLYFDSDFFPILLNFDWNRFMFKCTMLLVAMSSELNIFHKILWTIRRWGFGVALMMIIF